MIYLLPYLYQHVYVKCLPELSPTLAANFPVHLGHFPVWPSVYTPRPGSFPVFLAEQQPLRELFRHRTKNFASETKTKYRIKHFHS